MGLNGAEVALRITGVAAKEVATMLYAIFKDNKKQRSYSIRKSNQTGRPLTILLLKQVIMNNLKLRQRNTVFYTVVFVILR
ncbi:hypothetical protein [Faecalibacillus intestinalis]|uniref:hypothetical protein n=1 Tax=Faecalibacillus intestinalis TaxID=1982626 RepID=UPI0039962D5A